MKHIILLDLYFSGSSVGHNLIQSNAEGGTWWLSGKLSDKFGAFRSEGRRFESHSNRHVWTLGKYFTRSCLLSFGVSSPTLYQCCSRKRFSKATAVRSAI